MDHKGLRLNQETLAVYTLLTLALSSYDIFATCKLQTTHVTLCYKIVYFFNASAVKDCVDHKGLRLNQETLAVYTLLTIALSSFATCK